MRGLRSTLALLVVLGGLVAYIYFVTLKQSAEPVTTQEKVFPALDPTQVNELVVTAEKGDVTSLKKTGDAWQMVAPVSTHADESNASGLATALAQIQIVRMIDPNPPDLKEYGLTTPRIQVEFKIAGDQKVRHFFIGDKTPTGADMFAKRDDDKQVFLVGAFQEPSFNRTTFELRDKVLFSFDREKVDGLDVNAAGKAFEIAKDGADWKLTRPDQLPADFAAVEGMIGRVQSLQMKEVVTENATPAELKTYGLDKPDVTFAVKMGASAGPTLVLGAKADDTSVYARDASKSTVVKVENGISDDLKKGPDDFRRKDVFAFRPFNADRFEVTRFGKTAVFEKVKAPATDPAAEEKWRRVSPAPAEVDGAKMDGLLTRFTNMRISSFAQPRDTTGLDAPVMRVIVKFDDGKREEHVNFGLVGSDVFVARPGETAAGRLAGAEFSEAIKALDELSQ